MKLVKASIKDINVLKGVCIDAYALNFHNHWDEGGLEWYLDNEFSIPKLTLDLADKTIEYYFIVYNEKHVGFIKIKTNESSDFSKDSFIEIEKIYVLPEYNGKGIGKFVLQEVIRRSKSKKIKSIFLSVIDTNLKAIAFYKKAGFEFHSNTILDIPYFKEELKGMYRMIKYLNG